MGLGPVAVSAQAANPAETALRDSLAKNSFILRNFSGATTVHAEWTGDALRLDTPPWQAFGVLQVRGVKFKDQQVTIYGNRRMLLRDKQGKLGLDVNAEPVQIDVKLPGAETADGLQKLKNALFFSSVSEALKSVPLQLRRAILPETLPETKEVGKPECDCSAKDTDACAGHPLDGLTEVKPVKPVMPELDAIGGASIVGTSKVAMSVDESGHVTDVWIMNSLGQALDNETATLYRGQLFHPATCHGRPVPGVIVIEADFLPPKIIR
jgi:hypothetical protein